MHRGLGSQPRRKHDSIRKTEKRQQFIYQTNSGSESAWFVAARDELLDTMLKQGLAASDIIKVIQKEIWNLNIDDSKKILLTEKTGEIEFRIVEGSDEFIQLQALLASFVLAGRGI